MLPTVSATPRRLDDYIADAGEEAVERLREAARPLEGARVLHLNSTAFGGGVAELLQSQVALLNDLKIDTTWAVLHGAEDFFEVTKTVHNGLQGADVAWTTGMESTYWERLRENAARLNESFDLWFIHDPQPAGLRTILAESGRDSGAWTWRCHIDLSTTNERVWSFFEPMVNRHDAAVFTLAEFVQPGITAPVTCIPPSIDPTSPKNLDLSPDAVEEILISHGIDPARPMVTQVSRFDPWKDPLGVIDAYRMAKEEIPDLQLVMAGSLADDDPEGMRFLELTEEHRAGDPDVHLLTNLNGVGNVEINAFQHAAKVVVQKSTREGFGLVVAEGMWKRKPVIGGNVGGIRLQIEDGVTGFLVDDPRACADRLVELLRDEDVCHRMGAAARERVRDRFLVTRELEDQVRLLASLR